jgi:hypothetical protein
MPIVAADIQLRLSGGGGNTDPNASLGGAKSSTQMTAASLHNMFDVVSGAESTSGDTEYRCVYIHNNHGTLTLQNAVVWIETQTPSASSSIEIALAGEGVNGTAETVANENTAPSGETFSAPANKGAGLTIGDIPAGQHMAVWVKRIISASAVFYTSDNVILKVEGETVA